MTPTDLNYSADVPAFLEKRGRLFFKLNETAELFGVSETTIRRWIRDGFIKRSDKLRHIQISASEIARVYRELTSD